MSNEIILKDLHHDMRQLKQSLTFLINVIQKNNDLLERNNRLLEKNNEELSKNG